MGNTSGARRFQARLLYVLTAVVAVLAVGAWAVGMIRPGSTGGKTSADVTASASTEGESAVPDEVLDALADQPRDPPSSGADGDLPPSVAALDQPTLQGPTFQDPGSPAPDPVAPAPPAGNQVPTDGNNTGGAGNGNGNGNEGEGGRGGSDGGRPSNDDPPPDDPPPDDPPRDSPSDPPPENPLAPIIDPLLDPITNGPLLP